MDEEGLSPDENYYKEERWNNWIDRIRENEFDPEDEDSMMLFFNLQDDITIACVNILDLFKDGIIDEERCLDEIMKVRDTIMQEVNLGDEDKMLMLEGVRTSLVAVIASCEAYLRNGAPEDDSDVESYVLEAVDAEQEKKMDEALGYVSEAGAKIIDGEDFEIANVDDEIDYGFVEETVNGLVSLEDAIGKPETIKE
ncbi:MAG: DUF2150 family protein [Halobacteria archaeon]